jgi:hypothetical protein
MSRTQATPAFTLNNLPDKSSCKREAIARKAAKNVGDQFS